MKIINKAIVAEKSSAPPPEHCDVHLFGQFFINSEASRHREILTCLEKNANNTHITHIHLLNEQIYTDSELGVVSPKIIQYDNLGKRLSFQHIIEYIRLKGLRGYFIFANSDIFFDDTLSNLLESTIHETTRPKEMFALLRYEYNPSDIAKSPIFGPRFDSQDTWIFHSNNFVIESQEKIFNVKFGQPGCDNKVMYLLNILGFKIINDPSFIKTYHYHKEMSRNYTLKEVIPPPWSVAIPARFPVSSVSSSLGINLPNALTSTKNLSRIGFNDNDVLREYISSKLSKNENFIIPRISGIENNFAYIARVSKIRGDVYPIMSNYLRNVNSSMKNNAGIKLSNIASIISYSDLYLASFESCELFSAWECWGGVMPHIKESHKYVMDTYGNNRTVIWSHALDIFNYIYASPWTLSFRGKRILIISSFAESIREKIPFRKKIYGIDLFPECEITTILPPQTQSDNDSDDFEVELVRFLTRLESIKDTYDIALVSCGGYCNPVCNYIFKSGKSAIYVGGTLQMMFGVLGNRWLKETPDVVRLFLNESWSRPKDSEKPKGSNKIEGGCYF
jgi:hypothetical protein